MQDNGVKAMQENGIGTAVVTGGASGFGLAVARALAHGGTDVALLDIDGDRAVAEAEAVAGDHGVTAVGLRVDVSSTEEVASAVEAVTEALGGCDLLLANVGVQHFGSVEATTQEVWRWMLDVNVIGVVRTFQGFLPLLRAATTPRFAVTASANALALAARLGAYQATKFAVVGLAESIRIEHPEIAVSVLYPSGMVTRHLESSGLARPAGLGDGEIDPDDLEAMMASRPMAEKDLVDADTAAANALAGILAGEPHVITHGELGPHVAAHRAAIDDALARVAERQP